MKLPAHSPDFNPIENAWALLDDRLDSTDPGTLETVEAFKVRMDNAVRWLNKNKKNEMFRMVENMQRRFAEALQLKGARTSY